MMAGVVMPNAVQLKSVAKVLTGGICDKAASLSVTACNLDAASDVSVPRPRNDWLGV
jgi:hypothetical protein